MSAFPTIGAISWYFCLFSRAPEDNIFILLHYSRYSFTKAFCIAFVMTFFSMFDVPVFWPILLCYWIVLFVLTMRRQIAHMIKYKYIPFNIGKQVNFVCFRILIIFASINIVSLSLSLIIFASINTVIVSLSLSLLKSFPMTNSLHMKSDSMTFQCLQKYDGKRSSLSSSNSRAD